MSDNKYSNLPNLYVVGTPIGNLQDMSQRAINILKSCDLILAEDTRHSIYLLQNFGISTKLQSYHQHNEAERSEEILLLLQENKTIALISDAGMPIISDPGYYLIKLALENNIKVSVVPGPSALTAAISISGIDCSKFCFEGFLSSKESGRVKALNSLANEHRAMVFYEAPHRLIASLEDIRDCMGATRQIAVLKELTKQYEKVFYGSVKDVLTALNSPNIAVKGEYVIVISGKAETVAAEDSVIINALKICLAEDLTKKQAIKLISKLYEINKNHVYELSLALD